MIQCKTIYTKSFILLSGFKNLWKKSIFPLVKMAADYAKIDRVASLDASFQQVPLLQNFWNFHNIVMKQQSFKISKEMWKKNIFLDKNSKKSLYYRSCIG